MVDPLFKKTSADFDESGARGLLLNHLCISQTGRMIFDASDANAGGNGDDPDVTTTIKQDDDIQNVKTEVDLTQLKGQSCGDLTDLSLYVTLVL
jgi:hypothetical protein